MIFNPELQSRPSNQSNILTQYLFIPLQSFMLAARKAGKSDILDNIFVSIADPIAQWEPIIEKMLDPTQSKTREAQLNM